MITLKRTFPESTSRTQTREIEIEKLKEISSVSVNTGSVSVTSVVDGLVTLRFTGGSYSRRVQTGGTYTPSDSFRIAGADRYGRTTTYQYTQHKWDGTSWEYHGFYDDPPKPPETLYYSSGGYTGTLSRNLGYTEVDRYDYPSNPKVGDIFDRARTFAEYYYTGTVTKPASDTRTYLHYYQYTTTINYLEKSLNMVYKANGQLRTSEEGWVKINGVLRPIEQMWVKVNGIIKEV